jgi:hypothetical protein
MASATVWPVAGHEVAERLIQALEEFESVCADVTPDEAAQSLDDATLQVFWRDWPSIGSWAGALWRKLDQDLAGPARPSKDPDLDEVGEGG